MYDLGYTIEAEIAAQLRRGHAELEGEDLFQELLLLNGGNKKQAEKEYARIVVERKWNNA